jgi:Protein of unknown function (DUF1592)/Protein of unknown function (DUF1588)/Protein of unknown function (DUF1587)/Protein of unknown function (DUF1585)/Protein of unknown function (DUF1595)
MRLALALLFLAAPAQADPSPRDLDRTFTATVRPFVEKYCNECHSGAKPKGELNLEQVKTFASVKRDQSHWGLVLEKLVAKDMPTEKAKVQPTASERQAIIDWLETVRRIEAQKNAGDPGVVLARRLSNAEYNYTIRDLTGEDIRPTREFPVDPANPAGFDNSGESLAMSPELMKKYLQAARDVANHLVFRPQALAFAPHPMLVETDRDKYCVQQIIDFYKRQPTDYADYFRAAWRLKHAKGKTLAAIAATEKVSPKYLALVWKTLEENREEVGPVAKLQAMWRALPDDEAAAAKGAQKMRDWVVGLRRKIEPRFAPLTAKGMSATAQPNLMWKNRQYATHRMSYDPDTLQIDGKAKVVVAMATKPKLDPAENDIIDEEAPAPVAKKKGGVDPDLLVPSEDRARYEAGFKRFAAVFPDAFYVSERGRNYLDKSKDRGRYLSAGFHNVMGYFRDDIPLSQLVLDEKGQKELDALWQDLDFVASAGIRTHVQFYLNESGEAKAHGNDREITSEKVVKRMRENYLARVKPSGDAVAIKAVEEHFDTVNAGIRWVEKTRVEAEPRHLAALLDLATRAYRHPLSKAERDDLTGYYRSLRKGGLDHEDAIRDAFVSVLMSPDFCYRIDLVPDSPGKPRPLSDHALASRLSYFLWSSMPDAELLAHAKAGDLHRPQVLVAQARRMLKDARVRGLATEFGGSWLDFRRFEELNTVDRERFPTFTNELREAMFEEPVRFLLDVFQENRSVLDFIYAKDTFVNAPLAKHYGMKTESGGADEWVRVDGEQYGRGGLLAMSAFLTKNAPGLRTSPVKRGYWVVKNVLGERIPPPPAAVPELPRDEAKFDLPLRDLMAKHREDAACAGCHARFDAMGLALESYGPVGEKRAKDLAGRPVDAHASFPGGGEGNGLEGLRQYLRDKRQNDFVDSLARKLLAYALGRSLLLSDDTTVAAMRTKLAASGYKFDTLVESIVTSPQFLTKRGREALATR